MHLQSSIHSKYHKLYFLLYTDLIRQVWDNAFKVQHLKGGFQASGLYPVNWEAIPASKLAPSIPYTSSTSVPAATAGPSPTSSSTSVSASKQGQLQPPRWCHHLPACASGDLSTYQCLPQVPVRSSHVTAARVPSPLSSCVWWLISPVTYRGRTLRRWRTAGGWSHGIMVRL